MIKKNIQNELGKEIFSQALQIFLVNAEKDITLMNLYIESKDYSQAKLLSHKLIGSCEAVGIKKMPVLLRELDTNLAKRYVRKQNLSEINDLYKELKKFIRTHHSIEIER